MIRYAILTREFTFEASHSLPNHWGKCRRPHGHSYRLQVSLRGPIKQSPGESDDGMVMDFDNLKTIVHTAILDTLVPLTPADKSEQDTASIGLDHNDLNTVTGIRTTAENLVHWIWERLVLAGLSEQLLYRIRLWETEKGFVEITHAERTEGDGYAF